MNKTRIDVEPGQTQSPERVAQSSQFEFPAAATLARTDVCSCIEDAGIIPALTPWSLEDAVFVAETLTEAGIPVLEISMNSPDAIEIISHLAQRSATTIVGAGSVRNADVARKCLDAGARFLAADGLVSSVVEVAITGKLAAIMGGLTLTEVIAAWDSGADFVKVVPCYAVGGHNYIRTLKTTIPQARLIAAGGVNQMTAQNYIVAGASGLSLGPELIPAESIELRQTRRIQELARRFLTAVDKGRE